MEGLQLFYSHFPAIRFLVAICKVLIVKRFLSCRYVTYCYHDQFHLHRRISMAKKETAHKDLQGLEETVVCLALPFIIHQFFDNDSGLHANLSFAFSSSLWYAIQVHVSYKSPVFF